MNKKELVAKLADHLDTSQSAAGDMVNGMLDIITNELKQGDGSEVNLPGFGKFVAKHRPSREMRNPQTGEKMMSKAKTSAQFKPSVGLKDL
ncbi:MAG: HU family DNA-binding protein [Pseudomonadota bacterium]